MSQAEVPLEQIHVLYRKCVCSFRVDSALLKKRKLGKKVVINLITTQLFQSQHLEQSLTCQIVGKNFYMK